MPVPIPGGWGGGISTCSYLVHVRMLSSLSLVQIGGKTQDASFPCLFWLLVYFLFRFVSVYKYVSLFVFFLNSSFSSWLLSAYSTSMCIRSLSCHTSLVEERCVTCKEWLRPCPASQAFARGCRGWRGSGEEGKGTFFSLFVALGPTFAQKNLLCKDHFSFTIYDVVSSFELLVLT